LSGRYSNSPTLHLGIAESRLCRLAHGLLCLLGAGTLCRLQQRGYPVLALALLLPVALCGWSLTRQPLAGAMLNWSAGEWWLGRDGNRIPILIDRRSTWVGRVIYLAWVEQAGGRRDSCLLFPDCAPADGLRNLRGRITLER